MEIRRLLTSLTLALGLTLAVLAGLGGNLRRARADTYTVTNTNASGSGSLRQAILDANVNAGHDTIDFGITGTIVLTGALPAISEDLIIIGPGPDRLAISGASSYQVFAVGGTATVTITELTVRDGKASYGGGVYVHQGSAMLSGVQMISNSAFSGGGVYVHGGSATLSGTRVVSNSAKYGGGIYVLGSNATLKVSGGEVISNSASDDGGGVCVLYARATLSGTRVVSNLADYGGGVYVDDGIAVLSGTRVLSNSASGNGGGVYVNGGSATLNVSGGQLGGNSASRDGGGMYVNQGSATLSGARVFSNLADFGGGLYILEDSATLNVSGGELDRNSASRDGGGVYVNQGSATLNGTRVVHNPASTSGGGVYILYGSATLSGTQVFSNSAATKGGGVHVEFGSATLSGTQVISNSADFGGGLYVFWGGATLSVNGGKLASNTSFDGGGVYILYGRATLSGTQVLGNSADHGGGVYVYDGSATLSVSGGKIGSNSAITSGGGVFIDWGSAMLNGTQVVSNSAVSGGGGVYVKSGSVTLSGTQVVSNSANTGGGVYVYDGSATLNGPQITANDATTGSGLYTGGTITPTTALTITGEICQTGGRFAGSSHDLRLEGSLSLAGGDFYAPDAPNDFVLGGPFTHIGGVYHQTRGVNGSGEVGFPKAGGVVLNANGLGLGSTEVALTAGADCAGVPIGETVHHCYVVTPTNTSGRDAVITFFYRSSEMLASHTCATMEAYRWTGAWDTRLVWDGSYGSDGRLCGPDPQSLRVTGVSTFSLFVLRGSAADVRISKVVTPAAAVPGQAITYTLTFSNAGLITATGVVITDTIPVSVTNTSVISGSDGTITLRGGTRYVWEVADLAPGAGGVITITGVLSDRLASGVFTNTAVITTRAVDSDITNNSGSASVTVSTGRHIYLPLVLRNN